MLWWLRLVCTPCRVHTQLNMSCMYVAGMMAVENVLTKSFMLCHLSEHKSYLTSVMWLAKQALDLSFYVVACHNDRQAGLK